ncbi:MAG: hypothetical protein HKN16_12570, partial [Saprospiraceae bacterium]|nr:hypothetical protein [Saprospiraceae bacterium]
MFSILDKEAWPRKHTFDFYKDFEDPFTSICARVEITDLLKKCKSSELNFTAASMFCSLRAVNEIQAFRLRLVGEEVRDYQVIHGGTTVLRDDDSFSYFYFDFVEDLSG